jgi:NADH:ubiquinone oxidoreductase subunit 5 (subunit L)/multisubunit Na+/H+ antiporter MnhA subunit/multisubunit Na+/H+ antiporter MnhB subunit
MNYTLLTAIFIPLLLVPIVAWAGHRFGRHAGWVALVAPLTAFALLLHLVLGLEAGARTVVELSWVPALGLNLTFVIDGLALFFGLVVSGVGVLVVFYATQYLDDHYAHHGRFYTSLLLFMGAMLGTVFAGNLLLLFAFWELTGIASFLLIGFLHEKAESRDGARMALLVTMGTGLAMLAGIILLGQAAGTYELAPLLNGALADKSSPLIGVAFVLMAIGAFGKSAQFPFHFWLPNAMAAPTPVSAYLHSATMVMLGVFLVARIFPVFQGVELWAPLLILVCFGTMLLGAVLALLSHDLKAVLAFSTVSQLGYLMGFYGMGGAAGVQHDLLHISSHVFYKGCLFMVVGIIDHSTGERDLRRLGGLRSRMPLTAVLMLIGAASMAGLPGTLGFVSKEVGLMGVLGVWESGGLLGWYPLMIFIVASVIKVAFSARLYFGVFGGSMPVGLANHFHAPGLAIQLPPLLLAAGCLLFGLFPGWFGTGLAHLATTGLHDATAPALSLWHGITRELIVSMGIVALGAGLFWGMQRTAWVFARVPGWLRFDRAFEALVTWLPRFAKKIGVLLRFDQQFDYLVIVLSVFVLLLGGYWMVNRELLWTVWPSLADFNPVRTFVVGLIIIAVGMIIYLRRWTSQLIALSIVGFLITFYYVLFRAPDLAMTQILVESAILLLVLLLLARFPRSSERSEIGRTFSLSRQVLNVVVSVGVGLIAMFGVLMTMQSPRFTPAGDYYLNETVTLAHGTNAVNTILVDFRGFDTLLEITVLVVACLGAIGLVMRYRRTTEEYAAGEMGPAGYGISRKRSDRHPEEES